MKTLKQIFDILEDNNITIYPYKEGKILCGYELNTYSKGGVNMIIYVDFIDGGNPKKANDFIKKFFERIDDIDIDEEIDVHRQDTRYKEVFTIRQSVEDFEDWKKGLQKIVESIKK